jgi:hypothetical protein
MHRFVAYLWCLACVGILSIIPQTVKAQGTAVPCSGTSATFAAMETPFILRTTSGARILLTGLHLTTDAVQEHPDAPQMLQQRLATLLAEGPLTIAYSAPTPDKTGTCQAQVTNSKGVWVQERALMDGLAVFSNKPVADAYMSTLLLAEQQARQKGIGLWQYRQLLVRDPASINRPKYNNTYQIVEGPVRFVRDLNRIIMTCLDDDPWKSVCMAVLRTTYLDLKAQGFDLMSPAAQGVRIRARGEVNYREDAGLKMFIDKPELIQIIQSGATTADATPPESRADVVQR